MGGYKLIDLKHTNLVPNAEAVKIDGIYDAIESTTKACVVTHCVLNGVEKHDRVVNFGIVDGTSFSATIGFNPSSSMGLNIIITDEDMVSLVEI